MFLDREALYRYAWDRVTQGGGRLLHTDNPLSRLLESVLYLSVAYLLAAKVIRALLRRLSLKQHARDSCAEATLLGVSTAVCLYLCWTELRPRRDVHRKENSLVGVFTHNRLFDEHGGANSTNGRAVFAIVSTLLLHATGVTWYNHGLDLQVVKKTAFFAFYVAAHNLRFKCLGSAAALVVTLVDLVLQLTRVVCCFECNRSHVPILTYLSFASYVTAWAAVSAGVLPWFFLRPCLDRAAPESRLPAVCFLCASLFVFYVIEVVTMPLLKVLRQWLLHAPRPASRGRLECVLIPPPERVLKELRELRAMKLRARAAQQEFDVRHGSCKKTRDLYRSLKMVMVVKRRIRNFRQARLPASSEDISTPTLGSESSGDPPEATASETTSDLHRPPPSVGTASETDSNLHRPPPLLDTASETASNLHWPSSVDTASKTPSDLHRPPPVRTASETASNLHQPPPLLYTASETACNLHQPPPSVGSNIHRPPPLLYAASGTSSDLHLSSPHINTLKKSPSDLDLSSRLANTPKESVSDLHLSYAPANTVKETVSEFRLSFSSANTVKETVSDLHLSYSSANTARETVSEIHLSFSPANTAKVTVRDFHLSYSPVDTAKETISKLLLSSRSVNTASEMDPGKEEALTALNRSGGTSRAPPPPPVGSRSERHGESESALEPSDGPSGEDTGSTR